MTESGSNSDRLKRLKKLLLTDGGDSLLLANNIEDNPICCVTLDRAVPCIAVVWKQYATSAQLRYVHEAILEQVNAHGVEKILGDDTALPTIHAEDQSWIAQNWMPRAMAAGLRAAASKRAKGYFGHLAVARVQSMAPTDFNLRLFENLNDARRWLQSL